MAHADYILCAWCRGKAIYAHLNHECDYVMALCDACKKDHALVPVHREYNEDFRLLARDFAALADALEREGR